MMMSALWIMMVMMMMAAGMLSTLVLGSAALPIAPPTAAEWSYIPFITPMHFLHPWWYLLLLPLAFGIALVYKAMHLADLQHVVRSSLFMALQIVLAVIALAVVLAIIVQVLVPMIPVE